MQKSLKTSGNRAARATASVYFNGQRPAIVTSGAGRRERLADTDPSNSDTATAVCVHAFARMDARTRVRPFVRDVFAIYDKNAFLFDNILQFSIFKQKQQWYHLGLVLATVCPKGKHISVSRWIPDINCHHKYIIFILKKNSWHNKQCICLAVTIKIDSNNRTHS